MLIYWIIGAILQKLHKINERFRCKYILHSFGKHGKNCHIEGSGEFTASNIYMSDNCFIGCGCIFLSAIAKIYIGNNVMFGPHVIVVTGNHRTDIIGKLMIDVHDKRATDDEDVLIEDDVWIGMGAMILKGVTIGRGSIVGAGAIVTHSLPPYSIYTGVPNTRERLRFTEEQIKEHEQILYGNG